MKIRPLLVSAVALFGGAALAAGGSSSHSRLVAHGRELVMYGGCEDCHTPHVFNQKLHMVVPDMSRELSGHPENGPEPAGKLEGHNLAVIGPDFTSFIMPFGTVYSANLTPDKDTGIGSWTFAMFERAMRTGKHMGGHGRAILPPMPWPDVAHLSHSDLRAVWAYLRSVKPIKNAVPAPKVPPPAIHGITMSTEMLVKEMSAHHGHGMKHSGHSTKPKKPAPKH